MVCVCDFVADRSALLQDQVSKLNLHLIDCGCNIIISIRFCLLLCFIANSVPYIKVVFFVILDHKCARLLPLAFVHLKGFLCQTGFVVLTGNGYLYFTVCPLFALIRRVQHHTDFRRGCVHILHLYGLACGHIPHSVFCIKSISPVCFHLESRRFLPLAIIHPIGNCAIPVAIICPDCQRDRSFSPCGGITAYSHLWRLGIQLHRRLCAGHSTVRVTQHAYPSGLIG